MRICERCGEPVEFNAPLNRWYTAPGGMVCFGDVNHEVPEFPNFHDLPAVEAWLAS